MEPMTVAISTHSDGKPDARSLRDRLPAALRIRRLSRLHQIPYGAFGTRYWSLESSATESFEFQFKLYKGGR